MIFNFLLGKNFLKKHAFKKLSRYEYHDWKNVFFQNLKPLTLILNH